MKFAARFAQLFLLLLSTAAFLWLAGCGTYGGGGNGGGGGGSSPAAPTGLAATPANAQVNLTSNASSGATGYYVKRSTTSGSETQIAAQPTTGYTDNAVTNGTKYYYVVSAYNSYGQSANSAEVNATPVLSAPVAPTSLTATPGNMQVTLSWSVSTGATSYHIKRSTTNGSGYAQISAPATTGYIDTGLTNGTTYCYIVTALNTAGESANSNQTSATPSNAVADVTITIDPTKTKQISPYIYGINFYSGNAGASPLLTFDRAGGNRWTAYNWETNASNAGSDYFYYNDGYLSGSNVPAEAVRSFIAGDQGAGLASLVTFQLQGYVSADESGPVLRPFPNLARFKQVIEKKSTKDAAPFTTAPPTTNGANWFADKYLAGIQTASAAYGKPIVDVYDFHWYSEATDGTTRVINMTGSSLTDAQIQAIVQSPRSLWDSTFTENSWITNSVLHAPISILTRIQSKIDAENQGMKLAITEYENGGFNHIAGTIAQADNLGIFGGQGVFAANFWPPNGTYSYALAGFRAFRGFDGANASFGDTSLQATSSAVQNVVIYASLDSATPGRVVFVAINRSNAAKVTAINGQALSGTAHLYQMTAASAQGQNPVQPVTVGTMPVSGSSLTFTLPAYSVTTIDVR